MNWILLIIAGLMEIAWAISLKQSAGFTRLWPSIATFVFMSISVVLLTYAVRTLPIGTAFAVWTGIGTVGTVAAGILLFGEPATIARLVCIGLIVSGIVGLKLFGGSDQPTGVTSTSAEAR